MPSRPDRPLPAVALSRRAALLGGLGLGVAGCSFDGMSVQVPGSAPDSPSPSGAAATPAARDGDTEADERLVAVLDARLAPVLALVTRTSARHPGLRARLRPLATALRADLDTLRRASRSAPSASPSASATPAPVPAGQEAALDAVLSAVRRLRAALRTDALSALSGRFARLIAAMAAALSQRLRTLDPTPLATRVPDLSGTPSSSDTGQDSPLQDALAGEHAAVYVYSVLGAQTSRSSAPDAYARLAAAYVWHRDCRDRLVGALRARGLQPVAASPSYALPDAVATASQVTAAARVTEERVSGVYGRLVQETVAGDRAWAVALLEQSAERALVFGARASTFPGLGR